MRVFLWMVLLACSIPWSSAAQVVVSAGESTGGGFLSIDNTPVFVTIGATRLLTGLPSPTNTPPTAAQIISPADLEVIVIGGTSGANAVDPATPFVVTWSTSTDPEGQAVSYTWQLADANDFASVLLSINTSTTRYETDFGALSAVLDNNNITLNQGLTLFHRVLASDGQSSTTGAAAQVTLIRGTLTASEGAADVPEAFTVQGNYPNPFNPTTTIVFDLAEAAEVRVEVSDLMGRLVRVLEGQAMAAGSGRTVAVEASDLASGTYLYRVVAQTATGMQVGYGRMVLLK